MKLLVLVGSLRADSFNAQLADVALENLPLGSDVDIVRFDRLGELPFYNESLDAEHGLGALVDEFRALVADADAILIATPEHNGGPTSVIKNAVDIASRPRENAPIAGKSVAVIGASASPYAAARAREALVLNLQVAGAKPLEHTVGIGSMYTEADVLKTPAFRAQLRSLLTEALHAPELAFV